MTKQTIAIGKAKRKEVLNNFSVKNKEALNDFSVKNKALDEKQKQREELYNYGKDASEAKAQRKAQRLETERLAEEAKRQAEEAKREADERKRQRAIQRQKDEEEKIKKTQQNQKQLADLNLKNIVIPVPANATDLEKVNDLTVPAKMDAIANSTSRLPEETINVALEDASQFLQTIDFTLSVFRDDLQQGKGDVKEMVAEIKKITKLNNINGTLKRETILDRLEKAKDDVEKNVIILKNRKAGTKKEYEVRKQLQKESQIQKASSASAGGNASPNPKSKKTTTKPLHSYSTPKGPINSPLLDAHRRSLSVPPRDRLDNAF